MIVSKFPAAAVAAAVLLAAGAALAQPAAEHRDEAWTFAVTPPAGWLGGQTLSGPPWVMFTPPDNADLNCRVSVYDRPNLASSSQEQIDRDLAAGAANGIFQKSEPDAQFRSASERVVDQDGRKGVRGEFVYVRPGDEPLRARTLYMAVPGRSFPGDLRGAGEGHGPLRGRDGSVDPLLPRAEAGGLR